jgi:YD repeat-containing protein
MRIRFARIVVLPAVLSLALPLYASLCVPGSQPAQPDPAPPPPPVCEPKPCERCSKSPCYLATGMYVDDYTDLQIPTIGMYPLTVSRRYDSSHPSDGPLGTGWSSSLTAHLYYATYLLAAPSTYSYEADVVMPDGVTYQFTIDGSGAFTPPFGRHETLVRNGDGTYSLTLQHTRSVYRFNSDGSLASLTDDYGDVIAYTYASGRLQHVADASGSGRYIDVTWGPDGRVASITDNSGRVLKYFYEAQGGTLTSYSDPLVSSDSSNRTTYYSYVSGRFGPVLGGIQDRWHRTITALEWYSDGKLKSYTQGQYDASNPSSSPGEKYVYTYAPRDFGGSVEKANSLGSKTYVYSSSGLVNDTATYDAAGNVATVSTGTGTRSYGYDGQGNVTVVNDGLTQWAYTYDANFPEKVASIVSNTNWAGRPISTAHPEARPRAHWWPSTASGRTRPRRTASPRTRTTPMVT